ncbi:MAG: SAM-dependent methyltransferase, partial [Acidimicrobiales bacterium]
MEREDWDGRYSGEDLAMPATPNPFIVEELLSVAPGRALDLGAGEGRHAIWLAGLGWAATAVDFSQVGLAKGERRAAVMGVRVDWVVADLRSFAPRPVFDLIISSFIHFGGEERTEYLVRAAGGLAPGGTLMVVGYDRCNGEAVRAGRGDPARLFTVEELSGDLAGPAGLDVVRADRLAVPAGPDPAAIPSVEHKGDSPDIIDV